MRQFFWCNAVAEAYCGNVYVKHWDHNLACLEGRSGTWSPLSWIHYWIHRWIQCWIQCTTLCPSHVHLFHMHHQTFGYLHKTVLFVPTLIELVWTASSSKMLEFFSRSKIHLSFLFVILVGSFWFLSLWFCRSWTSKCPNLETTQKFFEVPWGSLRYLKFPKGSLRIEQVRRRSSISKAISLVKIFFKNIYDRTRHNLNLSTFIWTI